MGIDLAEIERFAFDEQRLAWFRRRIFTAEEYAYARKRRAWPQHLAGCFAVKEAFRKAVGRAVPWQAVAVTHAASGAPVLQLQPDVLALLAERGVKSWHVSITHSREHAAAVVVLEGIDAF